MRDLEILGQDFRYALRSIRRQPALAVATVLTLALGLGLNVSVFTFLQGLLFRARVANRPETFIHLSPEYRNQRGGREASWLVSTADYRAYAGGAQTLSALAAWTPVHATLGNGDRESQLALLVTCNFFQVYGLGSPRLGRTFAPSECDTSGAAPVVLLGEEIWKNQFNSDPHILGSTIRLNRTPFTIVGVLPANFAGRIRGPGIWIPWTTERLFFQDKDLFDDASARWLTVEGRLQPGRTAPEARSELAVIAARLDRLQPGRQTTMQLTNGSFGQEPALRAGLFWIGPVVMGALTLILLIACTNVTVLQLSRAVTRRREMGIRLSIGAGRGRLMRMLLTEMLLLSGIAGLLSAWIAFRAPALFTRLINTSSMPVYQTAPDLRVMIYLGAIVLLATVMAGLSPAAESLRGDLHGAMKPGGSGAGSGSRKRRSFLVAAQVAMSLVLLICAALFLRAQYIMFTTDPGFETRRVLALSLQVPVAGLAGRLRDIPGVDSVAAGFPLAQDEGGAATDEIRTPYQSAGAGKQAAVTSVSTDYFDTLSIPLLHGRSAANPREAVVSQAFAQLLFAGRDPLGESVILPGGTLAAIVGVARDVQSDHPGAPDGPHLYRWRDISTPADALLIRFHGDTVAMSSRVRDALRRLDPDSQASPRTLRAILDDLAGRFSTMVRMVGILGALALSLAVLGIYGVVAFTVSQRTRELGIRMALGATKSMVVRLVLASGARAIAWGIAAGIGMALLAAQAVAIVLRHAPVAIHPRDPIAFVGVAVALALVAIAAMLRPAWRAAAADPVRALRDE
jgi:predicted permease